MTTISVTRESIDLYLFISNPTNILYLTNGRGDFSRDVPFLSGHSNQMEGLKKVSKCEEII